MAEMNDLLEEAAARSKELADEADASMNAIDDMVSQASEMSERMETAARSASTLLRQLTALITKTEGALESHRTAAVANITALVSRSEELKTHVEQLLSSVKNGVAELTAHSTQSAAALDTASQSIDAEMADLTAKNQELADAVEQDLQDAGEAISAFRDAVEAARAEYAAKQDEWRTAVDALETGAQEQSRAWAESLQILLAGHARALLDAGNHLLERHNETMEHLGTRFGEESPRALQEALEPLETVLETVVQQGSASRDQISARAAELLQEVRSALPVLEALRTEFQATEPLQ